jgi:hypothetical protein
MSVIGGYLAMAQTATTGIARGFDRAAVASQQVAENAETFSSGDKVEVSPEAVASAKSGYSSASSGIEKPLVDLRVSKYQVMANVRVLQTADQLAQTVSEIVK